MAVNVHDVLLFLRSLQQPDLYAIARIRFQQRSKRVAVNYRAEGESEVALLPWLLLELTVDLFAYAKRYRLLPVIDQLRSGICG